MNLILLSKEDFTGNKTVRLQGERHQHILDILKAKENDILKVGLVNGKIGTGIVLSITQDAVELKVSLTKEPDKRKDVTLILALPRPPVLKRVLFVSAVMGIKEVYLINSKRVEKTYWQSRMLDPEQIRRQLYLGCQQAGDTVFPHVYLKKGFKPFVEEELPGLIKGAYPIIADPQGKALKIPAGKKKFVVAVGPEGGFIDYELDKFRHAGFHITSLSSRIFNVETAVTAFISKLCL